MRRSLRVYGLLLLSCAAALAQRSTFYWLADAGGLSATGHTGFRAGLAGGGEIAIAKGFSAGPEIGFIAPKHGKFGDTVMGLGSLNGYYHIRHGRSSRFDPFATMGYAVLFRHGSVNMFQYGAGLNYWAREDLAFRTEFRDRTWGVNPGSAHLWSFRIGVSFTHLFP
jgi:hypothetical protein